MTFNIALSDKEIKQLESMLDTKIRDEDDLVYVIRTIISELGGGEND